MKYKNIKFYILFVFLVAVFSLLNLSNSKQSQVAKSRPVSTPAAISIESAKVLRVVDGDTIKVLIGKQEDTVRLIGIDSPEVVDEKKPVQCFGKEASVKAKEILNAQTVVLQSDPTQSNRDEYGRLLRYVFLNELNFNKLMINEGYAREYTFKDKTYKYQSEFMQAEKSAENEKKGLWGNC